MMLYYALSVVYLLLIISSIVVRLPYFKKNVALRKKVNTWWGMVVVFSLAMVISKKISFMFFGFVSFMALKEFFSMIQTRQCDRFLVLCAYLTIPVQFILIASGMTTFAFMFIPVYLFMLISTCAMLTQETKGFLSSAGTIHWGTMMMVFCFSHVAMLLSLPHIDSMHASDATLVLFLVLLTELNDVAQFIVGKMIGKHPIAPSISPNKTWEGFLGGMIFTTLLSLLIAQWLTPLTHFESLFAGLLISVGGFMGDVIMSTAKRDIGIKDFGSMLPGHGGVIDRVDSLIYTAPLFFYFLYYLHYS